ncbi:uncharacterized protein LOC131671714 isoform X2 [Phymastichus coffea]|uniref:uncharacterized protein LOC131671714 isoform X2 n=1 Tax=Phymastichus coffea TaxID=108790 RepID=UPI00273BB461|nr:uncharacterized protein LOC131671714 isoform X2 [Phymastichus coffea]
MSYITSGICCIFTILVETKSDLNMSDQEDNQELIDEIELLQNAIQQKKSLKLCENASVNNILNLNVVPKVETKYEYHQVQNENDLIDEDYSHSNNSYENYSCENLYDLLDLNKNLIDLVTNAHDNMVKLLEECKNRQRMVDAEIAKFTNAWTTSKIVSFNAGMPYFKDKTYFSAKWNEDVETKVRNRELRLADLQRIQRWSQTDKNNLLKAIRYEVTLNLYNRKENNEADSDNYSKINNHLSKDEKKAIGSLGLMKFDWLKIANNMPENKHTAEECEVMWNVFLHPDINKQKWTEKEDKNLNRIVEAYGFENWDAIARELNTKRSGYQCFVRYNTSNFRNLMKGTSWSPIDDRTLIHLVTKLKIGDYIPWGYIASCMNNWTKQQVYFRWSYSLAPHLKKGRFSPQEDRMLEDAVEKYGENFSKIAALVMNHRTNIQLKEHFYTLQAKKNSSKEWTLEGDEKLLQLKRKYGSNWSKIASEIPNISRVQARLRYASLMRLEKRGITLKNIDRNKNSDNNILTHTTVTYTTNTPWSWENREIYVKHMRIDDQLIHFFKKERIRSDIEKRKFYHPDKLQEDTKILYNNLLKFNAYLKVPNQTESYGLSEKYHQLLLSLKMRIETPYNNLNERVEKMRLQMFGPQAPLPDNERFIPPLPFGFCTPRLKKNNSKSIDYSINTADLHQTQLVIAADKYVSDYLGEEIEEEFEKVKELLTKLYGSKGLQNAYILRSVQSLNSVFFIEQDTTIKTVNTKRKYNWDLNKMDSNDSHTNDLLSEKIKIDSVPVLKLEPNRTTLQAYQELLLISRHFPSNSGENQFKLTCRGRESLYKFKTRYEQLFHLPTGLSRIIPPDVVDESAFLPALEKLQKKNVKCKKKKMKSVVKLVNTKYVEVDS